MKTFCGKNCDECPSKNKGTCPGCQDGPGKLGDGKCPVANCCRGNVLTACEDCFKKDFCEKRASVLGTSDNDETVVEATPVNSDVNNAASNSYNSFSSNNQNNSTYCYPSRAGDPFYAKYIFYMFILFIPRIIFSIILNNLKLELVSNIFDWILTAIQIGLLFILGQREQMFKKAAIANVAIIVSGIIAVAIGSDAGGAALAFYIIVLFAEVIVNFYAVYCEFMGYSNILVGVNFELSETWKKTWFWVPIFAGLTILSVLFIFISPGFGLFMTFVSVIGAAVLGILKLVWLYKTYKCFK